jgi:hypothetical protein
MVPVEAVFHIRRSIFTVLPTTGVFSKKITPLSLFFESVYPIFAVHLKKAPLKACF